MTSELFIDNIMKQLKESWNIQASKESVLHTLDNLSKTLAIMDVIQQQQQQQEKYLGSSKLEENKIAKEHSKTLKKLIDLSLEENKIIFDRLAQI